MAAVRGGIEDELVNAVVQISSLTKKTKTLQRALDAALLEIEDFKRTRSENSRRIQDRRAETAATHAKELEDMKKNEKEAIETAEKAVAELQKRNVETAKLKAELSEARAAAAEAASAGGPSDRRGVTATGLESVSPAPAAAAAAAGGAAVTAKRGARYGMDEEEENRNSGTADRTEEGGNGSGGQEEENNGDDEEEDEEEDQDDDDDDTKKRGGLFGWLTGSARKRRRGDCEGLSLVRQQVWTLWETSSHADRVARLPLVALPRVPWAGEAGGGKTLRAERSATSEADGNDDADAGAPISGLASSSVKSTVIGGMRLTSGEAGTAALLLFGVVVAGKKEKRWGERNLKNELQDRRAEAAAIHAKELEDVKKEKDAIETSKKLLQDRHAKEMEDVKIEKEAIETAKKVLQDELEDMKNEKDAIETAKEELQHRHAKELEYVKNEKVAIETSKKELQDELEDVKNEKNAIETVRKELQDELEDVKNEKDAIETSKKELQDELEDVKNEKNAIETAKKELQDELADVKNKMDTIETSKKELQDELEDVKNENDAIETSKKELQDELEDVKNEKNALATAKKELQDELEDVKNENDAIATAKKELQDELEDVKNENDAIETAKKELQDELEDVKNENDAIETSKKELQDELEDVKNEKNAIETAKKELQDELEEVRENEKDAIETATQANAELQKRNDETAKLKAELSEARASAAEAASAGGPSDRRGVTATGLEPVSPVPAAAAAGGAEATAKRGARFGIDEGEKSRNSGTADRTEEGGNGSGGEEKEEEEEEEGEGEEQEESSGDDDEEGDEEGDEEEDQDDDDDDGKKGTGLFGWLTGSARKRRRRDGSERAVTPNHGARYDIDGEGGEGTGHRRSNGGRREWELRQGGGEGVEENDGDDDEEREKEEEDTTTIMGRRGPGLDWLTGSAKKILGAGEDGDVNDDSGSIGVAAAPSPGVLLMPLVGRRGWGGGMAMRAEWSAASETDGNDDADAGAPISGLASSSIRSMIIGRCFLAITFVGVSDDAAATPGGDDDENADDGSRGAAPAPAAAPAPMAEGKRLAFGVAMTAHEARRAEAAANHAKELEDVDRKNRDAIAPAKKKGNDETVNLKVELIKARAAAAEAAPTGGAADRRKVMTTGRNRSPPGWRGGYCGARRRGRGDAKSRGPVRHRRGGRGRNGAP
eukprot:g11084.t1